LTSDARPVILPAVLVHVLAFRWHAEADPQATDSLMRSLAALQEKVAGIHVSVGKNISPMTSHLTDAAVVRAESDEAFQAYLAHPDHLEIAGAVGEMSVETLVIDFYEQAPGERPLDG